MNDRHTKRTIGGLLLALVLSLPVCLLLLATPIIGTAAVQEPSSAEPRPSARRTATRAIERRTSTQWLSDVAERLRVLEEHAERAAARPGTPSNARGVAPAQGGKLR